jgi:hypothetical protein
MSEKTKAESVASAKQAVAAAGVACNAARAAAKAGQAPQSGVDKAERAYGDAQQAEKEARDAAYLESPQGREYTANRTAALAAQGMDANGVRQPNPRRVK